MLLQISLPQLSHSTSDSMLMTTGSCVKTRKLGPDPPIHQLGTELYLAWTALSDAFNPPYPKGEFAQFSVPQRLARPLQRLHRGG